jgi:hypothetical protein
MINSSNEDKMISFDRMKGIIGEDIEANFYNSLKTDNVKKFYIQMEFNAVNNAEFYNEKDYSFKMMKELNRFILYTPQINNISMIMPSTPLIYQRQKNDKV